MDVEECLEGTDRSAASGSTRAAEKQGPGGRYTLKKGFQLKSRGGKTFQNTRGNCRGQDARGARGRGRGRWTGGGGRGRDRGYVGDGKSNRKEKREGSVWKRRREVACASMDEGEGCGSMATGGA